MEHVVAGAEEGRIVAAVAVDEIVAVSAEQAVRAGAAEQDVVTVLALPVLATVPAIITSIERRMLRRRRLITVCVSVSFVICGVMAATVWKFGDVFAWWR